LRFGSGVVVNFRLVDLLAPLKHANAANIRESNFVVMIDEYIRWPDRRMSNTIVM